MKSIFSLLAILCLALLLVGCQSETMVLLDEKIAKVNLSKSEGFDGMNEDILESFKDDEAIKVFEKAITTAQKQKGKIDVAKPEYDVMVTYTSREGQLPTHALHLWLGNDNEKSMLMYLGDDEVYLTTPQITGKLRTLILSEG